VLGYSRVCKGDVLSTCSCEYLVDVLSKNVFDLILMAVSLCVHRDARFCAHSADTSVQSDIERYFQSSRRRRVLE